MSSHERFKRPIEQHELRLLRCCREAGADFVFELEICLKSDVIGSYTAISYAWGDQSPVSNLSLRDGSSVSLTQSLTALFDALCQRSDEYTVWIDAICIDQANNTEKSAQVASMGDVYRNCSQVLVWLGAGDRDTDDAFRYIHSKKHLSWPRGWEEEFDRNGRLDGLDTLYSLLALQWFRRLWTMQEAVLGSAVVVTCGHNEPVSFAHLRDCIFVLWAYSLDASPNNDSFAMHGLRCITRLLNVRNEFQKQGCVPYEDLLEAGRGCETTDARDRVFALRGIAGTVDGVPMPDYHEQYGGPNYDATLVRLFTDTALALIVSGPSMDVLALAGTSGRPKSSSVPSWTPNLSQDYSADEPLTVANKGHWNAGRYLKSSLCPVSVVLPGLRLQAYVHDEVVAICPVFDFEHPSRLRRCVQELLVLGDEAVVPSQEWYSRRWVRQLKNALIFGLDLYDQPLAGRQDRSKDGELVERYEIEFRQWAHLLLCDELACTTQLEKNAYQQTAHLRCGGWSAGLTKRGFLCITPPNVQLGDRICLLGNCRFPLLLRACAADHDSVNTAVLISWCYVEGWMLG